MNIRKIIKEEIKKLNPNLEFLNHKVIWFDNNPTIEDIERVYNLLVDMGAQPYDPIYNSSKFSSLYLGIEENLGEGYFKTYSVEDKIKIGYGIELEDQSLVPRENWIYYKDFLDTSDIGGYFDDLTENDKHIKNNPKPQVGDQLYCHTDLVMDDGEVEATEGEIYKIIKIRGDELTILNNSKTEHRFSIYPNNEYIGYGNWFELMEPLDTQEYFGY